MKLSEYLPRNLVISLSLLLFAALLAIFLPFPHRILAACAMLFSTLGDLALMNYRKFFSRHTPSPFVTGGLFFMVSHVLYAFAYANLLSSLGARLSAAGLGCAVGLGAVAYLSLIAMSAKSRHLTAKKAILLALYASFEFADCAFVLSFALWGEANGLLRAAGAAGILSFIASDYFIGMNKMASNASLTRFVWVFYPIGQALMLLAA